MKTILRNLLSVLRRFKMATLLNILGLSVAFAAFILIMMQWTYDRDFDKGHKGHETIFRVERAYSGGGAGGIISRPLADAFIQSSPHIVAGALLNPWRGDLSFTVEDNGGRNKFEEPGMSVYPELTNVFDFEMVEGHADAMKEPDVVLIPQSLSRKLFGDASAMGKRLDLEEEEGHFTVGGVYKDFPLNSSLTNCIYYLIHPKENLQEWRNFNYVFYVRLDDPKNAKDLFENFKAHFDVSASSNSQISFEPGSGLRLTPLADVHFTTDVEYDSTPKASKQTLLVLFAIAIVLIVIAGINFTNFSTALTPMRIRSINTQKVLGGEESVIRSSLVFEAVLISVVSFLLGLQIVYMAGITQVAALVDGDISLMAHKGLVGITALIAVLTGLCAGIYPACYMTSFPPALVLKGSFGLSPKGRTLRNLLISIQFIASFGLIIGSAFMYSQNYFMQNTPLGYEKDQVIVARINQKIHNSLDAFRGQLKAFSGVEDVTFARNLLSSQDQYMGWGRMYRDAEIGFQCLPVDPSFLKVMGIEIKEGRDFREEDQDTHHGAYIFNDRARHAYDMELNGMVDSAEIVGFMPDVKFASFRTEVTPMAFYVCGSDWVSRNNYVYVLVKAGSDMRAAMDHVKASLGAIDPDSSFHVRFFDNVLDQLYEKEQNLSSLITLFSLVAIFISIVGVFGLVVFDSEYRKKEIGVRKVLGSTTTQIIVMFNKGYIRILLICFALAAPVAGYAVHRWLENFAYKTPMHWWVYLLAFLLVFVITILTVTFQNWHAANENPVKSLKSE